jgi:hypothetical protein
MSYETLIASLCQPSIPIGLLSLIVFRDIVISRPQLNSQSQLPLANIQMRPFPHPNLMFFRISPAPADRD